MANKAIKGLNRKEMAQVCPPHGHLTLKLAEKTRQQKEWEKANAGKITGKDKKSKDSKVAGEEGRGGTSEERGERRELVGSRHCI